MDFSRINTFIFDVDGVLTDGMVHPFADGEFARVFNIKDGYAIEKALKAGYRVCIISGGFEKGVRNRLEFLSIPDIYLGVKDKVPVFMEYINKNNILPEDVLYMGDDMPDIPVMQLCGISSCPADAADDVLAVARYISPKTAGKGAVRDVIERTMKAQNTWYKTTLNQTA